MGERKFVPAAKVTATDLIRLLVWEEATKPEAHAATQNEFNEIVRRPNQTIAVVATRLTDEFRASLVSHNRPHATEELFFGDLADLMRRLSQVQTPEASQHVGDKAIITFHAHRMAGVFERFFSALTDLMIPEMCERRMFGREAFENLADIPRTRDADRATHQGSSLERNRDAITAVTSYNWSEAPPVGTAKVLGGDDAWLSVKQHSIDERPIPESPRPPVGRAEAGQGNGTGSSIGCQGSCYNHMSASVGPRGAWDVVSSQGQEPFENKKGSPVKGSIGPRPIGSARGGRIDSPMESLSRVRFRDHVQPSKMSGYTQRRPCWVLLPRRVPGSEGEHALR